MPIAILANIGNVLYVQMRMIAYGSKGIINLEKIIPGVGALIGGGFDLVETKIIADRAYKWFMLGDFSLEGEE